MHGFLFIRAVPIREIRTLFLYHDVAYVRYKKRSKRDAVQKMMRTAGKYPLLTEVFYL